MKQRIQQVQMITFEALRALVRSGLFPGFSIDRVKTDSEGKTSSLTIQSTFDLFLERYILYAHRYKKAYIVYGSSVFTMPAMLQKLPT
jgi:hypothetical protein